MRALAAEAHVSVSTVSRYLAGQLSLKPETEAVLLDTLRRHGLEPRAAANARDDDVRAIGLVVPEMSNPYFGAMADGVVRAAEEYGYSVLVTSSLNHSRRQSDDVALLLAQGVQGIIYAGRHDFDRAIDELRAAQKPAVVLDKLIGDDAPLIDVLSIENAAGAYQATTHLLQLNHRRIAFVGGPEHLHSVRERLRGYRQALRGAGIDSDDALEFHGEFSEEFGAVALSLIQLTADSPTAVFAASDTIALGMIAAAETMGIVLPEALSIVGFDGIPASTLVRPALTTVQTPMDDLASAAVRILMERIDQPERGAHQHGVSVALVVRDSATALR
jgi:DNA-binding LacI/PurR family transcriptional regulator